MCRTSNATHGSENMNFVSYASTSTILDMKNEHSLSSFMHRISSLYNDADFIKSMLIIFLFIFPLFLFEYFTEHFYYVP